MTDDAISLLVVDDSALMRKVVSEFFKDTPDVKVVGTARNGLAALDKIGRTDPDVIILDLQMPEMDGMAFLKERKKRGLSAPVIILSTLAQKGARITMEALALGASDFIPKPTGSVTQTLNNTRAQLIQFVRIYGRRVMS